VEGEKEDAVHVLYSGVLVLQLGERQLLADPLQLALVGLLVDPPLVDVDLDQPLPPLLDRLDARGGPGRRSRRPSPPRAGPQESGSSEMRPLGSMSRVGRAPTKA
jgi:hypothetical protein